MTTVARATADRPGAAGPVWAQTPRPGTAAPGRWDGLLLASWIALCGPLLQAWRYSGLRPWWPSALLGVGAVVLTFLAPPRAWFARWAVAAAAGLGMYLLHGTVMAGWMAAGLLLATWVAQDRPPLPFLPRPGPGSAAPVAVLTGIAAWQGIQFMGLWKLVVPFGLACLLPLLTHLGHGLLQRVGDKVGHVVGTVVSAVLFTLLGLLAVLLPWAFQRLLRRDPLRPTTGWGRRERLDEQAGRPWAPDPHPRRRSVVPAVVGAVAVLAAVGLVAGAALWRDRPATAEVDAAFHAPAPDPTPPGPWYADYRQDVAWALDDHVGLAPFETQRLLDVQTRTVNVTDGHRVTAPAPAGRGRPLHVWVYGGNGAFGFEQRDDHTVASELQRVAAAAGVDVVVSNRGVPGQGHWRESLRFGQDLATLDVTQDPRPDLVVFYDGFEEVLAAQDLTNRGIGDVVAPYEAYGEQTFDRLVNDGQGATPPPPGVESAGWPTVPGAPAASVGELAARRYARARTMTEARAKVAGVPVVYVWQPSRGRNGTATGRDLAAAAAALPPGTVDLTHALDRAAGSFVDDVHHDEAGAALVARTLFASLRPQLELLREARR